MTIIHMKFESRKSCCPVVDQILSYIVLEPGNGCDARGFLALITGYKESLGSMSAFSLEEAGMFSKVALESAPAKAGV
jgi:hypothetical protein